MSERASITIRKLLANRRCWMGVVDWIELDEEIAADGLVAMDRATFHDVSSSMSLWDGSIYPRAVRGGVTSRGRSAGMGQDQKACLFLVQAPVFFAP